MSFPEALFRRRRRKIYGDEDPNTVPDPGADRQPFDERLPNGTPAMQVGLDPRLRQILQGPSTNATQSPMRMPARESSQNYGDIALGEDYGKSGPSLYRVQRSGDNVSFEPFTPRPDETGTAPYTHAQSFRDALARRAVQGQGQTQTLTPTNQQTITRPRQTFNTTLTPDEEVEFEQWKQKYAPNDSGQDYDLRGAFKAGVTPDAQTGHWPDQFKKPNHPTFSNESQYATGANATRAGRWQGDQYQQQVAPPEDQIANQDLGRERAVSFDPQTGRPREEFYRERGDTPGLYQAYQNWTPHGAKRGLRNSLKSGLAMMSEAVRNNPDDPVTAAIAGFGIGAGGGTAVPNFKNRLIRQWKMGQLGGEVKNDLEMQKQQAAIDASQMVPVQLDNGQYAMVPAKQAGTLQSKQQEIGIRGDTLEARKRRWDQLGTNDRKKLIVSEYRAGLLNNDPRALEQAARELDIPGELRPAFISGQMRDAIDDNGNLLEMNRQTGDVVSGPKSYETVKETGRNRRAAAAQAGATQRTQIQQQGADRRSAMGGENSGLKRQAFESEAQEWSNKETSFRRNKQAEDDAIRIKSDQLQKLYQEQPGGTILNRGGRTSQEINSDRARLAAEIKAHKANAQRFQEEADKAAGEATKARRNASMQPAGTTQSQPGPRPGTSGRANDGKYHYKRADIKAQADANGVSYQQLLKTLQQNPNVVIDP